MPELDEKKRIIAYDTVNDPDENYYALIDNGTAGTGKVSIKGLGPADMISDQYSDSSTYKVGDLCIHNNKLYVCTVAINTPHAFNLSEWELDTLGNYATEIKQSLSDSVTLSLNQASGKISAISGSAYRQGKVVFVSIDLTMNAVEGSNWIELGTISPAPPKNIRQNTLSDTNMSGAIALRTQIDSTTGKIKIFFGGAASFSINMVYMTS